MKYKVKQLAEHSFFYTFEERNSKGEQIEVEFNLIENNHTARSIMRLWYKNGYTKKELPSCWSVQTYVTDKKGHCWGRYNPQAYPHTNRINFDYVLEGTEENKEFLLNEICKLAFQNTAKKAKKGPEMDTKKTTPILTGKYAKLRDDLRDASLVGLQAALTTRDGIASNSDSVAIDLPRWNSELVELAATQAGCIASKRDARHLHYFVFTALNIPGQGFQRTKGAKAMAKALEIKGYDSARIDYFTD